jgi:O-succinylhomoserine sulfhydrylase
LKFHHPNKDSFAESPTNPAVDIIDLELLGKLPKTQFDFNDNCFATLFTATYENGSAFVVVHSATKLMDGQGRVLGGVTVGDPELIQNLFIFRLTGPLVSI